MRLTNIYDGHGWREGVMLRVLGFVLRTDKLDGPRTLLYRRELFGTPFGKLSQRIMRDPSVWSVGERELMAAFVSKVNQCPF